MFQEVLQKEKLIHELKEQISLHLEEHKKLVKGMDEDTKHEESKRYQSERKRLLQRLENAENAWKNAKVAFDQVRYSSAEDENLQQMLEMERKFLGSYISGHPLDPYQFLYHDKNISLISDAAEGNYQFAGMIQDIRLAKRKSDGSRIKG